MCSSPLPNPTHNFRQLIFLAATEPWKAFLKFLTTMLALDVDSGLKKKCIITKLWLNYALARDNTMLNFTTTIVYLNLSRAG